MWNWGWAAEVGSGEAACYNRGTCMTVTKLAK